ncbi:MAG: glycosyltransferase [Betaproteobacteria bacterium]|nr:glycosyltransferase [Betaproteobacteria bacterium]
MNDASRGNVRAARTPRIGVVLKGYPRLSETFVAQELAALERRGLVLALYSLRRPTDASAHPVHDEIAAPVDYLPEYLHEAPGRVLRAWASARRLPGYGTALAAFRADFARDRTRNRVRRFGQALVLAAELPADIGHLHAHFLHTPASVARYAALMRGLPWSVSAHAKDIWTTPDWEKREKLASCAWAATCTRANAEHLRSLAADPARVELVYHGLDARRFPSPPPARRAGAPVVVLSVGRAVEKKGFDDLLAALARLPAALDWRFEHVGGGPLLPALRAQAAALRIAQRVVWHGPLAQPLVLARYRAADVFALPSRIAADGDRDGLPNVLMEAQSQRLPCVATAVSGIPELIEDGRTGLLVQPRDVDALAGALAALIADPALRQRLGDAGCERTRTAFDVERGIDRLVERFHAGLLAGVAR